jgi:phosphoribosylglycinamide formyltransferase-1
MNKQIRIGSLISGGGSNLQAIIDNCESGDIDGRLVFVGSDNSQATGLDKARKHGVPTFVVDYASIIRKYRKGSPPLPPPIDFDLNEAIARQSFFTADSDRKIIKAFLVTRAIAEANLLVEMQAFEFDLLVLAGFMRNLTPYFIDRVNTDRSRPRIMNIHPSLLPSFAGTDGYGDTWRYGCKVGGCTVHFVDYGEDTGPIIGQRAFQILEEDTLESIKQRGLELEWQLYSECIQHFARQRLQTVRLTHTLTNGKKIERTVVQILPSGNPTVNNEDLPDGN